MEWNLPLPTIATIMRAMSAEEVAQCSCVSTSWRQASFTPDIRGKVQVQVNAMLHELAKCGDVGKMKVALSSGADIESTNSVGMTPLQAASLYGHVEVVQALIDGDANLDAQGDTGQTALIWAACRGHLNVVKTLTAAGANIDAHNSCGCTAMMEAALGGHVQVLFFLLSAGAMTTVEENDNIGIQGIPVNNRHQIANSLVSKFASFSTREEEL